MSIKYTYPTSQEECEAILWDGYHKLRDMPNNAVNHFGLTRNGANLIAELVYQYIGRDCFEVGSHPIVYVQDQELADHIGGDLGDFLDARDNAIGSGLILDYGHKNIQDITDDLIDDNRRKGDASWGYYYDLSPLYTRNHEFYDTTQL